MNDMDDVLGLVDDLSTQWWMESVQTQQQAIANAFRAALLSPQQHLKWTSIIYQDLLHIPATETDPNVFEQTIRDRKKKWDQFGQLTLDLVNKQADDPEWIDYGNNLEKYRSGIWEQIRRCAEIGKYIEPIRQAAIEDIAQGGDGRYFRQVVLDMNIPGIGPKVSAFSWLLLAPQTSRIATIDRHMMRAMGRDEIVPGTWQEYQNLEDELDEQRKAQGYDHIPLGAYQWAIWDQQRTPGYKQDHTGLRPLNPVDWRNIDWQPAPYTRKQDFSQPEEQTQMPISKWKKLMPWNKDSSWSILD